MTIKSYIFFYWISTTKTESPDPNKGSGTLENEESWSLVEKEGRPGWQTRDRGPGRTDTRLRVLDPKDPEVQDLDSNVIPTSQTERP